MIMFRIPIAQPPKATRKSAEKGRIQWCRKLRELERPLGCSARPYAPETGKIGERRGEDPGEDDPEPHLRRRGQHVADREHGVVEHLPPSGERADLVPGPEAEQDRRDEQRERVGSAPRISSETGVGKFAMLRPRSPWKSAAQKLRYCFQSGTSNPNASV